MNTLNYKRKRYALAGASALILLAAPLALDSLVYQSMGSGLIAQAYADDSGDKGGKGSKQGGKGHKGDGGQGKRGGNKSVADLLSDDGDDDSDRPPWAQGNKELNPHRGTGSGGTDTQKGGDYGDIWIILRDDLGNPILDANGNIQPCLDTACTEVIHLTDDGELPPQYADDVIEVEFGRLNIARAPSKVLDHSLVEAMAKLDGGVLGEDVTLDPSGRLVIDGSTIDSPLENLAIYKALVSTEAVDGVVTLSVTAHAEGEGDVTYTFSLPEAMRLDVAASAFAAASDKTGDLSVDEVVNISKFMDVDDELAGLVGDYQYSTTDTYGDVKVWILVEVSPGVMEPRLVNIMDYVDFNSIPPIDGDSDGIDRFAQAADDSVQVLEFVHDNALDQ